MKWYQSKIVMFNILIFLLGMLNYLSDNKVVPEKYTVYVLLLVAMINNAIRIWFSSGQKVGNGGD